MVEENNKEGGDQSAEKQGLQFEFVDKLDKDEEERLAAFLGKVTAGFAAGDAGSVPEGIDSTLNAWMEQLQNGNFQIGGPEVPQPEDGAPATGEQVKKEE